MACPTVAWVLIWVDQRLNRSKGCLTCGGEAPPPHADLECARSWILGLERSQLWDVPERRGRAVCGWSQQRPVGSAVLKQRCCARGQQWPLSPLTTACLKSCSHLYLTVNALSSAFFIPAGAKSMIRGNTSVLVNSSFFHSFFFSSLIF